MRHLDAITRRRAFGARLQLCARERYTAFIMQPAAVDFTLYFLELGTLTLAQLVPAGLLLHRARAW